jgi:heterodisulfide reductase subunit B
MRQKDISHRPPIRLPVFYFTQLLGLAMGCSESELSLGSLFVDTQPLLRSKGLDKAGAGAGRMAEVRS